jgi:hypothetical protein
LLDRESQIARRNRQFQPPIIVIGHLVGWFRRYRNAT